MARILFMIKEISNKISRDHITNYAAQSCFYIVLSFFPCLLVLMSLVHYLPISPETLISLVRDIAPSPLEPMLETLITDVYANSSFTLISVTAVGTLWAAGKSFMAIIQGLNIIYEAPKERNWIIQRFMSTIYTLIFLAVILTSLILLVFGNRLANLLSYFVPSLAIVLDAILSNKMLLFPCILIIIFMAIYKYIPNRKSSIAKEFPGALIAAIGWCLFSYCYSLYVDYSPNFSYMYGSLTTLIFALIWLYTCMIILFFGAEFNTFLSKKLLMPLKFKRKKKQHIPSKKPDPAPENKISN